MSTTEVTRAIRVETSVGEETVIVTDLSPKILAMERMFAIHLCPVCGVEEVATESGFGWYPDGATNPLEVLNVSEPEVCKKCTQAPDGYVWCHTCQMYTTAVGEPTCGCR